MRLLFWSLVIILFALGILRWRSNGELLLVAIVIGILGYLTLGTSIQ